LFTYGTASTAPLALFFEDIEVRVKEWGSTGPFQPVTPFSS
jgi:hypothetical protein